MGQLATTIAGGFVGFLVGGPLGAQIGMTLGGMVGATLFGPTIKGPRLSDLKVTASTYGMAIPEVYGTVRVGGNMIWSSGIKENKKKSSGKGGPKQITYTYDATFAMALCKGPITDITRIWADGKIIYDATGGTARIPPTGTGGVVNLVGTLVSGKKKKNVRFRLYKGTEDQLPDSLIVADKGATRTSAHRGIAYVLFEKLDLTDFGNRIPQLTFEVSKQVTQTFPNITAKADGARAPNATGRYWIPDWGSGRLLSFNGSLEIFNLENMERVATSTGIGIRTDLRNTYVPGRNIFYASYGLRNSTPISVYDTRALVNVATIAEDGNGFYGFYVPGGAYRLGNLGCMGYGNFGSGAGYHLMLVNLEGAAWCLQASNGTPIFVANASFIPEQIIEGRNDADRSEMIGWRSANNRLELEIWRVAASASTEEALDSVGNRYWVPSTGYSRQAINIQPYVGEAFSPSVVLYDQSDKTLFVMGSSAGTPCAFKIALEDQSYKFKVKHLGLPLPIARMRFSRLAGGSFGYITSTAGRIIQIDLQNGSVISNVEYGSIWGGQFAVGDNQHWDDVSQTLLTETIDEYRRISFSSALGNINVASIVQDVCIKGNVLTNGDIDTSALRDGKLIGYMIDRESSAQDVIRQLATGFMFDGYESDFVLKFRSRGNASQVTIPESWIGRQGDGTVVKETLTQELELPMRISVNYYDITRDHQQGTQSAKRKSGPIPTMWTRKEDVIQLPIVWGPDDAKQCADKLLKMAWANRTGFAMSLPFRYLKYDPSDVATVTLENGTSYSMRFTEATIGVDFTMEVQGSSEKATAYDSAVKGSGSITPGQTISVGYDARAVILNTPLLRDLDFDSNNNSTCYFTASTDSFTFTGATLFMDANYEYVSVGSVGDDAVTGFTTNILPKTKAYEGTDERTVLNVIMVDAAATLESITQEMMLDNFVNAALVGDEVIQYRDAVQQPNGSWNLSGILRARRGTNYAVNDHTNNDRFILLNDVTISKFIRAPLEYVTAKNFKAVPSGSLVEDASVTAANLIPRDLMPYTPEDVKISDDGTTVTISAQRRSRIVAPLADATGSIHYKEGDKPSAKLAYKIWPGLGITNTATVTLPGVEGFVPLFDSAGLDVAATFTFPLTDLGVATKFLLRLTEVGVVDGTPKWVEFERLGQNRWNETELY